MKYFLPVVRALRALHRRYKLLFVLTAAWSPILLAHNPLLAGGVIIGATTLFWVSISTRAVPSAHFPPSNHIDEEL